MISKSASWRQAHAVTESTGLPELCLITGIEKTQDEPVQCLPAGTGLIRDLQSICDTEKTSVCHF